MIARNNQASVQQLLQEARNEVSVLFDALYNPFNVKIMSFYHNSS